MTGPLPDGNARRRNAPTIPTTQLPAEGSGRKAPRLPRHVELGPAGTTWWRWAWKLPQAAAWDDGALYHVIRRAQLEDMMAALEVAPEVSSNLVDLVGNVDDDYEEHARRLRWLLSGLVRAAGGATTLMREARELDNRLGLNPKALAELRWKIVPTKAAEPDTAPAGTPAQRREGFRVIDPAAVGQ